MSLFALTNARPIYRYSFAAGYRSTYPYYYGQWTISWPIRKPCVVHLAPHDSHNAATDVYPPSFPARVDKCVEMMAGIISNGSWKIAFPGRAKHKGPWILEERPKGFGGAHGARHLYNMQGDNGDHAVVYVALDYLPWLSLSWSLHRGMKDLLLAQGKSVMNQYRVQLASAILASLNPHRDIFVKEGWAPELVDGPMASMAESAVLSGSGNSGDVVRIVVAIVECVVKNRQLKEPADSDMTGFWGTQLDAVDGSATTAFFDGGYFFASDMDTLVALTKFFVLEWSQEPDYQLYNDLPVEILLA